MEAIAEKSQSNKFYFHMHTRACSIRKVLLSQQVAKVECPEGKQSLCVQLKIEITGVSPQGEAVDCNSIEGFLMLGSIPRTPTILLEGSSIGRAPDFDSGGCRFESCPSSQILRV